MTEQRRTLRQQFSPQPGPNAPSFGLSRALRARSAVNGPLAGASASPGQEAQRAPSPPSNGDGQPTPMAEATEGPARTDTAGQEAASGPSVSSKPHIPPLRTGAAAGGAAAAAAAAAADAFAAPRPFAVRSPLQQVAATPRDGAATAHVSLAGASPKPKHHAIVIAGSPSPPGVSSPPSDVDASVGLPQGGSARRRHRFLGGGGGSGNARGAGSSSSKSARAARGPRAGAPSMRERIMARLREAAAGFLASRGSTPRAAAAEQRGRALEPDGTSLTPFSPLPPPSGFASAKPHLLSWGKWTAIVLVLYFLGFLSGFFAGKFSVAGCEAKAFGGLSIGDPNAKVAGQTVEWHPDGFILDGEGPYELFDGTGSKILTITCKSKECPYSGLFKNFGDSLELALGNSTLNGTDVCPDECFTDTCQEGCCPEFCATVYCPLAFDCPCGVPCPPPPPP